MKRSNKILSKTNSKTKWNHARRHKHGSPARAGQTAGVGKTKNQSRSDTVASKNKTESIIALLRRPGGTGIADLCKATGWQAHSVRGALSGTLKKKLGLKVISAKIAGMRTYRIAK